MEGGSANDYDYAFGDPISGYDLTGLCGLFGNPFKKCKKKPTPPAFDISTIDHSTGRVIVIASSDESDFPNGVAEAVHYNFEIIGDSADTATAVAGAATLSPCSVACAGVAAGSALVGAAADLISAFALCASDFDLSHDCGSAWQDIGFDQFTRAAGAFMSGSEAVGDAFSSTVSLGKKWHF